MILCLSSHLLAAAEGGEVEGIVGLVHQEFKSLRVYFNTINHLVHQAQVGDVPGHHLPPRP